MIDINQARELLKRAMETKGRNFVYNSDIYGSCYYEPHGETGPKSETGCLIGVALTLAGKDAHIGDLGPVSELFAIEMTSKARQYFRIAQIKQDQGSTWGKAYDAAEKWLEAKS